MIFLIVLLTGSACGLFCFVYLASRQHRIQRSRVKSRLVRERHAKGSRSAQEGVTPSIKSSFRRLPFIGPFLSKQDANQLKRHCEAELPRMLDILAMGMQSGLSFDTAFGLYVNRFDTKLAQICRVRFDIWERGLISRSDGLEQLAKELDLPLFERFCRTSVRSMRYGVPMTPLIKEYASQARKEYRDKQKEQVLKAPVKMLLPTGVLILPAMMMLVIGPIILDVTGRMV